MAFRRLKRRRAVRLLSSVLFRDLAQAMCEMYVDADKRHEFGQAGRKFVCETYELNQCFEKIEEVYLKNAKKQKGVKTPV